MKILLCILLISAATMPALANKKPTQDCKVGFAFVYIDRLDNTHRGIQGKELKEVQKKLSKYGDICYTDKEDSADFLFFVHTKPAVYHGVETTSRTSTHTDSAPIDGTITDEDGNRSRISGTVDTTTTTRSTSSVPYEVDYSVFILDILSIKHKWVDGAVKPEFTKIHTLDQKGLYNTIYGIGYGKGKKPIISVIDAAAKWLHENNINLQAHEESKPVQDSWAQFRNDETFMRADEAKKAALLAAYFEIHLPDYGKASEEDKKAFVQYVLQQLKENPR